MKSVASVKPEEKEERKYPYLGVFNDGKVVLFIDKGTGIQVYGIPSAPNYLGYYSECWSEDKTKPYTGSVTLSND